MVQKHANVSPFVHLEKLFIGESALISQSQLSIQLQVLQVTFLKMGTGIDLQNFTFTVTVLELGSADGSSLRESDVW